MASCAGLFLLTWVPWGGYAESSAWYDQVEEMGQCCIRRRCPALACRTFLTLRIVYSRMSTSQVFEVKGG